MRGGWPFVGRVAETADVTEALTMGRSGGVVVVGPAGVGKSRLADEVIKSIDPSHYVVKRATAMRATATIRLGALARILPADIAADQGNLLGAAAEALVGTAGRRRLILEIDDTHLLDELSAALISQLVRAGEAVLLGTLRSEEAPPEPLAALMKERLVARLELRPLHREQVAELLAQALDGPVEHSTAAVMWQVTQGNALFVREMVAAGLESGALRATDGLWAWHGPWLVAPRLLELIQARLNRLGEAERHAMELLAFAGTLGLTALERLCPGQALERLETEGLVWTETDGQRVEMRLGHPLHAEAIRALLPVTRARARQRELADLVESMGARRVDDPLRVALWRLNSGGSIDVELMLRAARQAWAKLDLPLVQRLARLALQAGGGKEAARLAAGGHVLAAQGSQADVLLDALPADPASQLELIQRISTETSNLFYARDEPDKALDLLARADAIVTEPQARDHLIFLQEMVLVFSGQTERGLLVAEPLLNGRPADESSAAQAWMTTSFALSYLGRFAEARSAVEKGRVLEARCGAEVPWLDGTLEMAAYFACVLDGDLPGASEIASRMHARYEGVTDLMTSAGVFMVGQVARLCGRTEDAVRLLMEGRRLGSAVPGLEFLIAAELSHAAALTGNRELAGRSHAEAAAARRRGLAVFELWGDLATTWVTLLDGGVRAAIEQALDCAARARACRAVGYELIALHDVVRLGAAPAVADRLGDIAADLPESPARWYARHAVAAARHDGPALHQVAHAFAHAGANLLAAEAATQASAAYSRAGRRPESRASALLGARLARRCGQVRTPALGMLEEPKVTERERQIARLAAGGMTDQQIADELHLTTRTVSNHLYRVYFKLGAKGRHDLRFLLDEPG